MVWRTIYTILIELRRIILHNEKQERRERVEVKGRNVKNDFFNAI